MAKNNTELLNSIKTRLDSFINNPLLNPDYSEMSVGDNPDESITGYLQEISNDIELHIEMYESSEHLSSLVSMHDAIEATMLKEIIDLQEDVDVPSSDIIDELYEDLLKRKKS